MRWVSEIIAICIIMVSLNTATGEDISDLKKLSPPMRILT
jgi:hypothetical protein